MLFNAIINEFSDFEKKRIISSTKNEHRKLRSVIYQLRRERCLSYSQERFWLIEQLTSNKSTNNNMALIEFEGNLDVESVRLSLDEIFRRHEILRSNIILHKGRPIQIIRNRELPFEYFSDINSDKLEEFIIKEQNLSFDIMTEPLIRSYLCKISTTDKFTLIINMHHLITDGWSFGILIKELALLYNYYTNGGNYPLSELKKQYYDFSIEEKKFVHTPKANKQLNFWKEQLSNSFFEVDYNKISQKVNMNHEDHQENWILFSVDESVTKQIEKIVSDEHTTVFNVLVGIVNVVLYKLTQHSSINIGTPYYGRLSSLSHVNIGCFINNIVLRNQVSENDSFVKLLNKVTHTSFNAFDNAEVPYELILRELRKSNNTNKELFNTLLIMDNSEYNLNSNDWPHNLKVRKGRSLPNHVHNDLVLSFSYNKSNLEGFIHFDNSKLDIDTVQQIKQLLLITLETITKNKNVLIGEVINALEDNLNEPS